MTDLPNSESTDTVSVHTSEGSASPSELNKVGGQTEPAGAMGAGARGLCYGPRSGVSEGVFTTTLDPYRTSFLSASTGAITLLHVESDIENLERAQVLKSFAEELNDEMIDQPPEAAQTLEENFWDLF